MVDRLVEDALLVELKAVKALEDSHRIQCLNYLKATGLPCVCCSTLGGRVRRLNAWCRGCEGLATSCLNISE
jgi:hypothetical protein